MTELLAALRPSRARRIAVVSMFGIAGAVAVFAFGRQQATDIDVCGGGSARLNGVWDAQRERQMKSAFAATQLVYAPDAANRVERALDSYAAEWVAAYARSCEQTRREELSPEIRDLRMACLERELVALRALTDVFVAADTRVVEHAATAAQRLDGVAYCEQVDALSGRVLPPRPDEIAAVTTARRQMAQVSAMIEPGI